MRILVCGGRDFEDDNFVHLELTRFHWRTPITVLIHGAVSGAGMAAETWARRNCIDVVRYPPNWERLGKKAEGHRNHFMLADSRPDVVLAFPGGRHTADLVEKAAAAGIRVVPASPARTAGGEERKGAGTPAETDAFTPGNSASGATQGDGASVLSQRPDPNGLPGEAGLPPRSC